MKANTSSDRMTQPRHRAPQPSAASASEERVRVQKVLARAGLGSRREIEAWIAAGRVRINDRVAKLGDTVAPGDRVKVDGKLVEWRAPAQAFPRVILYHKPAGEIVSRHDPQGRPSVFDRLPLLRRGRWIAVGRLDFNTSGLLLFTTDGDLANRLMHPRYGWEREYVVRVLGELTAEQQRQLTEGIVLEDGLAKLNSIADIGGRGSNHWYRVTISEGRNREVRRLFGALGLTVSRLMRVRYGPIGLPSRLRRGMWMELPPEEIARVFGIPLPPALRQAAAKQTPARARPRSTRHPSP